MEAKVAQFVQRAEAFGLALEVREMAESTHTAAEAAAAVGAPVAAIVKSLVFVSGTEPGEPILVLASGPNRVDTGVLEAALGVPVVMADAKTVKRVSGSSIGGVPPLGHPEPLRTLMDEDLMALEVVWAAAASPRAVFPIPPRLLAEVTRAEVLRISQE